MKTYYQSQLKRGINGLPYVELRHPSGARLEIYLHGAHLTSWRNTAGQELLFMSKKSSFDAERPIRGGIPVIFPQFGDGHLPKHGFARIREWKLLDAGNPVARHQAPPTRFAQAGYVARNSADFQNRRTPCGATTEQVFPDASTSLSDDGWAEAVFELRDNKETIKFWPHQFRLELVFRLGPTLEVLFSVFNTGDDAFSFQNGLHTYFSTADIGRISIMGLAGAEFVDFLGDKTVRRETRERITFDRETDRVYPSAPDTVVLEDDGNKRKMVIEKQGMSDVVVWNPGVEKSRRLEDFGDEEYKNMVCIETGNLHNAVKLSPGTSHISSSKFIPLSF